MSKHYVCISSWNHDTEVGIYVFEMSSETGTLNLIQSVTQVNNGEYMAFSADKKWLYVTSMDDIGYVNAFAVDPHNGHLTYHHRQPTGGSAPCYVSVMPDGQHVFTVDYAGTGMAMGNFAVFPVVNEQIQPYSDFHQLPGASVNAARQEASHPHMILPDPTGKLILVPDLGLDRVLLYRLTEANQLVANTPAWLDLAAGAGPRHLAFHPTLPFLYVINELDSTITVFQFAPDFSAFTNSQTITTLPDDIPDAVRRETTCADIHITPDGRFLYGSNRGHDSLAIFSIDATTGLLTSVGYQSTLGSFPRSFALDASGQWLVCANQNTNDVQVFRVNPATGLLTHAAEYQGVSMPICVRIVTPVG